MIKQPRWAVIVIWMMLVETMDLHYDYYVSDHFCGIANNIEQPNAGLHPTVMLVALKIALHILPMVYVTFVLMFEQKAIRLLNLIFASIYCAFHAAHFMSELSQTPFNSNRVLLLGTGSLISAIHIIFSYKWLNGIVQDRS